MPIWNKKVFWVCRVWEGLRWVTKAAEMQTAPWDYVEALVYGAAAVGGVHQEAR
jgi:hypothetical protein